MSVPPVVWVGTETVCRVFVMLMLAFGALPSEVVASDVADNVTLPIAPVAGDVGQVFLIRFRR